MAKQTLTKKQEKMVKNANIESAEISVAFEYIKTGRDNDLRKAVENFYYIGEFVCGLDARYAQKIAKQKRDAAFENAGEKILTANEATGCRQIFLNFETARDAVSAYMSTGKKSLNPARVWASLRPSNDADSDKKADALKNLTAALDKAIKDSDTEGLKAIQIILNSKLSDIAGMIAEK